MILYVSESSLPFIFEYLSKRYARIEEVPSYADETSGYNKLVGVLKQSQADQYYPTLTDKATYLLVQINKGHFFSNGNKRLALVAVTFFLAFNDLRLKTISKDEYKTLLAGLFPEYSQWADFPEFTETDFATYHLSIIVAESGAFNIGHDDLKERVKRFFDTATESIAK